MWINYVFLAVVGIASGMIIAGGYVAVITMLGVIPRLATLSKTVDHVYAYENSVILGTIGGNLMNLYDIPVHLGYPFIILYGLFAGIYVGGLAVALEEIVNAIPIFARRYRLRKGLPYLVYAFAFGKLIGSFTLYFMF
ncbi:MAG: stage V sporulation protein AB [Lachnospiraceae bacterium]